MTGVMECEMTLMNGEQTTIHFQLNEHNLPKDSTQTTFNALSNFCQMERMLNGGKLLRCSCGRAGWIPIRTDKLYTVTRELPG